MTVSDLGPKGRDLWSDLCERVDGQRGLVLLEEACRIADRLDRLDALLIGDQQSWARIQGDMDSGFELVIDSTLAEARQQAGALRQLLSSIPLKESGDGNADAWLDELPTAVHDS